MTRIVSLLPAATEIVYALGHGDNLVGRSHECDYPPEAESLAVVSEPRLDPEDSSAVIDQAVKALVTQGLGVFEIDADTLRQLEPDIIITQIQCEVCAVSEDDVRAAVDDWLGDEPTIVSVRANSLAEVFDDIAVIGEALEAEAEARALIDELAARLQALRKATSALTEQPSVVGVEWVQPLMASGNWIPELVEAAGGYSLLAEPGQHSPWIDWDQILAADPDVIVVSPCGFSLERAAEEVALLEAAPGWTELSAVRANRVFAFEGHHYLHRPGPRLIDSAEYLAELLHGIDKPPRAGDVEAYRRME